LTDVEKRLKRKAGLEYPKGTETSASNNYAFCFETKKGYLKKITL